MMRCAQVFLTVTQAELKTGRGSVARAGCESQQRLRSLHAQRTEQGTEHSRNVSEVPRQRL